MVHFWNPGNTLLAITWVSGTLQYAPKACPVKFNGLGCWGWAVMGSDSWDLYRSLVSPSEHRLIRQIMPDERYNKTQTIRLTREGRNRQTYHCLNLVCTFNRVQQNNRDPKRFSGCRLKKIALIPAKRGSKTGPSPQTPGPAPNVRNIIANTPGKLMAPEKSFWKSTSDRDFHTAHLGTTRHKLSVQGCLYI